MVSAVLLFASFAAFVSASPVVSDFVLHEKVDHPPEGFSLNGPAQKSQSLSLRIALVSKDMAGLEKALYDVSTPGSALYGQHLSKEEVESFVSPTPETVTAVDQWLSSFGVSSTKISPAGDWIRINVPVSKANELLNTQFSEFTDTKTGKKVVRTLSYSIPETLQGHVDLVHPTVVFPLKAFGDPKISAPVAIPRAASNLTSSAVPASCANLITPACLQALYDIPTAPATQASNGIGVPGFFGQFAQYADLQSFLQLLRPDLVGETFGVQTIDGGINPQSPASAGNEANLDIQYTVGIASNVPTTFITVGPNNGDDLAGFLDIIIFLLSEANPPKVLTTSYGFDEYRLNFNLANNLCNAYLQLGARGTSILFASGDGGVSGGHPSVCTTFVPTFPSGCPFVTSVGGTTGISPETSANLSSGGFSNFFPRPLYQDVAVSLYLNALGGVNAGRFNPRGRAFPDVSAQALNVVIVYGGVTVPMEGTSCSSPIFASVIALLNDQLIAAGRSPLGFLNPFLYSLARTIAFNDITTGSNPGCGTFGFPATLGWDPVTGLGTPKFAALRTAVGLA